MKLSKRQRQFLKTANNQEPNTSFVAPEPLNGAARKTVVGLVKRKLVEWVDNDHWPDKTEYRITAKGSRVYRATIPVPDDIIPMEFCRMGDNELKTFVLHYCDGKLLCDFQVPENVILTVFMPLVFGGLAVPHEMCPTPPIKPVVPEWPEKPEPIPKPTKGRKPKIPKRLEAISDQIKEIRAKMDWGEADEDDIERFLACVADEKLQLEIKWEEAQCRFLTSIPTEEDKAHWAQQRLDQAGEYHQALCDHEHAMGAHQTAMGEYREAKEAHRELNGEIHKRYLSNLGVSYEYIDKAVSSMSVNGFPVFGSMRLVHKLDWERAQKAISKEMKRREDLEI